MVKETISIVDGVKVTRKENRTHVSIILSDSKDNRFLIKLTKNSKDTLFRNVQINFPLKSDLSKRFGVYKKLTLEEINRRHMGKINGAYKLKTSKPEGLILKEILIPEAKAAGLNSEEFFLKEGMSPYKLKDGPFVNNYSFHSYTNIYGENWVIYIEIASGSIWLAGTDVNWKWKNFSDINGIPWVMTEKEKEWIIFVLKEAKNLNKLHKEYNQFVK